MRSSRKSSNSLVHSAEHRPKGSSFRRVRQKSWPSSPRGLSGLLRRLAPNLRAAADGIAIAALDRKMDGRNWQLSKLPAQPSCPSSPSSPFPAQQTANAPFRERPSCPASSVVPLETRLHDGHDDYDGLVPTLADRQKLGQFVRHWAPLGDRNMRHQGSSRRYLAG